ncbi:MAG TPA: hypothetical protein VFO80_12855, partial [Sphingomonas sp.]|nr:hypothetical protein [Sphingomonas sp.]
MANTIDMVEEIAGSLPAHRVEDDVDALPPRKLGRRDEIAIASDQNDLIDLSLECHGCHVKAKAHVYAFLRDLD